MTTTFFFAQHVHFALELGVRLDGARHTQNLTTLNVVTLGTTQQNTNVLTSTTFVQQLAEHLNTGTNGLHGIFDTDDFHFVTNLDDATLNTTGYNRTATRDGEHVLDRHQERPFLMPIEDVFSISGRGTVVTGRVERGIIKVGDEVEIVGIKDTVKTVCTGVEMFRKLLDEGRAGENVGVLLRGTKRDDVERGQVLCVPGSIKPHTKFECEVYVLSKEEGGRHTPFFKGYRPQFYFRTTDVTGSCELPEGVEMVMPGDNVKMSVTLIAPIAMEDGLRFAIREGGRTVGAGVVSKIIE